MPIRRNWIRVLPNPWTFVHPELGPQGACHVDTSGRMGGPARFLSAAREVREEEIREYDVRGDRQRLAFSFPSLNETLTDGEPMDLPRSPYYLDRLRDGDLVPADDETRKANECRFKDLAEARAAGIAAFEAEHGEGTFAEVFPALGTVKGEHREEVLSEGSSAAPSASARKLFGGPRVDADAPGIEPDRAKDPTANVGPGRGREFTEGHPPQAFDPSDTESRKGRK